MFSPSSTQYHNPLNLCYCAAVSAAVLWHAVGEHVAGSYVNATRSEKFAIDVADTAAQQQRLGLQCWWPVQLTLSHPLRRGTGAERCWLRGGTVAARKRSDSPFLAAQRQSGHLQCPVNASKVRDLRRDLLRWRRSRRKRGMRGQARLRRVKTTEQAK